MDGRVSAMGEDAAPHFRCRLELMPIGRLPSRQKDFKNMFPVLEFSAFKDFTVYREQENIVLDAYLEAREQDGKLHAGFPFHLRWRVVLVKIEQ